MTPSQDISVKVAKALLGGVLLCFIISSVGLYGFLNSAYGPSPHYAKWAFVLQRISYYICLCEILIAVVALIVLPRRLRTLGVLFLSFMVFSLSGYLTEGEPEIHYSGPPVYIPGPSTDTRK